MASYLSILSSPTHLLVNSPSNIQYVFFQGFNSACHCFYNLLLHLIAVPLSEHLDADNSKSKIKLPLSKMWYFKWFCCLRTEQNCLWDVKYFFQYLNHQGIYRTRSLKSARDCDRRMGLHAQVNADLQAVLLLVLKIISKSQRAQGKDKEDVGGKKKKKVYF